MDWLPYLGSAYSLLASRSAQRICATLINRVRSRRRDRTDRELPFERSFEGHVDSGLGMHNENVSCTIHGLKVANNPIERYSGVHLYRHAMVYTLPRWRMILK